MKRFRPLDHRGSLIVFPSDAGSRRGQCHIGHGRRRPTSSRFGSPHMARCQPLEREGCRSREKRFFDFLPPPSGLRIRCGGGVPGDAMDYYQKLGLRRSATKEEIKEAFRRCALESHPDRHAHSTQEVRDRAVLRFKQASEAYEVLVDDGKRAEYDARRGGPGGFGGRAGGSSSHRGYGYGGGGGYYGPSRSGFGSSRPGLDWELVFRYLMSRRFLLNVALASALLGSTVVIERSGDAIWKMNNAGKSFEEAMESIEKIKVQKEKG